MGNASKKLAEKCHILNKEEQREVGNTFRLASRNSSRIREEDLIKFWGPQIDPRLAQYLSNFLFGPGTPKSQTCDFNRFAELYVYNVRGSPDERMAVIYNSLGQQNDGSDISYQLLKEYCECIASTYIRMLKCSGSRRAALWAEKGFQGKPQHVQALGEAVAAGLGGNNEAPPVSCNATQISKWLSYDTLLRHLSETVFVTLYGTGRRAQDDTPTCLYTNILPIPEGLEAMPDYPAFVDLSHIVWLNSHLPQQHQGKWRFLFSSHIHGESFSTMAGRITEEGPSMIIIEDSNGYIFGGFAAESWTLKTNFYGNEDSFLFTLTPKMRVYPSTGFNNHYQYMNNHTKTLPNGIIMGGQFEFGGIWIPADPFGEGSSAESCTTYRGYKRLSKEQHFKVKSFEVWGVGEKPVVLKENDDDEPPSILDKNPDAKAILEMAGKTQHSDGVREPPPL